jgi:hypothetical protein
MPTDPFTSRQADQAHTDFAIIEDELEAIHKRLCQLPTWNEVWRAAMLGGAVAAVTLIETFSRALRWKQIKNMKRRLDSLSAQHCREQAERLRELAAKARSPTVQRDYRELASEWDKMAEQIEMLSHVKKDIRWTTILGPPNLANLLGSPASLSLCWRAASR